MIRTLLCTTALMLAAPAIAQSATAQDPAATAAPAQDVAATQTAPAQAAEPAATSVASIVDSEFPAYDIDQSGKLEKAEFGKWMVALKDQELKSTGKTLAPAEVTAWANGAFTSADGDKDGIVSKDELVTYLSGGA